MRDNQLASLPFSRSGRAEALLFDKYPELAEKIERGKRAKIDAIVLSNKFVDVDGMTSTSFRAQSLEELMASPLRQRTRRKSRDIKTADSPSMTPKLKGKSSVPDLIFEMSDGEDEEADRPLKPLNLIETSQNKQAVEPPLRSAEALWSDNRRQSHVSSHGIGLEGNSGLSSPASGTPTSSAPPMQQRIPGRPWGATPLGGTKFDMKDIMYQASTGKPSNLTLGLTQQDRDDRPSGSFHTRISQKERKRQQQTQQPDLPGTLEKPQPALPTVSPWQAMSQRKPTPSGSPLVPIQGHQVSSSPASSRNASTPQLTMRQTIANHGAASKQKSQPQTLTQRSSSREHSSQNRPSSASGPGMSVSTTPIPTPRSVRHIPLPSHSSTSPSQHLSMTEILSIQQAEKDYVKDAATKRSLQEIQQEQEFQEWWDQESKRVIHEEEQRKRAAERGAKANQSRGRGRGGKGKSKGKDRKDGEDNGRGKGNRDVSDMPPAQDAVRSKSSTPKPDGGDGGKGRGKSARGGRGGGRPGRTQGPARETQQAATAKEQA